MSWRRVHRELKEVQPSIKFDRPGPPLADKVVDESLERRKQYRANYDSRFNHQPFRLVQHKKLPFYDRYPRIIAVSVLVICVASIYSPFISGLKGKNKDSMTAEEKARSDRLAKMAKEKLWMFSPETYSVKKWFEKKNKPKSDE